MKSWMARVPGEALLIHYYYPPIRSAGVLRNYFFSLEFFDKFERTFIITTSNRGRLEQEDLPLPVGLEICPVATCDYRTLLSWRSAPNHFAEGKKQSAFIQTFLIIQKTLPFNFLLGEGSIFYLINAFRKAEKIIRTKNVSVIYSSFGPYADHLVAYFLKGRHPEIKWIADFRDLQIEPLYKNTYFEKMQRWFEQKILSRANLVSSVSTGLTKQLERYGRPTIALERGVRLSEALAQKVSKFTICYTGSLYRDFRDADLFFQTLADIISSEGIDDIEFVYAGKDAQQFDEWIEKNKLGKFYKNLGYLSRHETLTLQSKSNIQLLLTSASTDLGGVLTGKLFEYLESGNPILVLIKGVYDAEFEELFSKSSAGIICYDPARSVDSMKQFILEHYRYWEKTGLINRTLRRDYLLNNLTWRNQHEKMLAAVGY